MIKQYKIRGIENEDDIAFNLTKDVTDEYYSRYFFLNFWNKYFFPNEFLIFFSRVCKLIQTDQGIDRLGECIANLLVGQAQTAKIIQVIVTYTPKDVF